MKHVMIITTTNKKAIATKLANSLIKTGLAACVQAWPISSTFQWKGKIMSGKEWILLIKSRSSDYKRVEKEINRIHNYELPEIISLPITKGSSRYLDWIDESTKR